MRQGALWTSRPSLAQAEIPVIQYFDCARLRALYVATIGGMERVELYAFTYYDELRKRWTRARYKATREDIAKRYQQFKLEGEPELREGSGNGFTPPGDD